MSRSCRPFRGLERRWRNIFGDGDVVEGSVGGLFRIRLLCCNGESLGLIWLRTTKAAVWGEEMGMSSVWNERQGAVGGYKERNKEKVVEMDEPDEWKSKE